MPIWHLGDVVGYGPEPDAVVERLTALGAIGVRGNHDAAASGGTEIDWFNPEARAAMEWTRDGHLRDDPGLAGGPPAAPDGGRLHARPRQPARPDLGVRDVRRAGPRRACRRSPPSTACTATPTSRSRSRMVDGRMRTLAPRAGNTVALGEGRTLLNPGSVGQPRDGDPRASYLILDTAAGTATWGRVAYDVDAVGAMMRAAGLPARLADRLRVGA